MRWNFAHILNKSLIRPISYENSLWSLSKTKVFEAQTFVQLGCEFIQNMAKFQCIIFGCLFIFYHIPEVYRVDNYKIEKFKWCVWKTAFIPPIKAFFLFSTAVPQPLYIFSCKKQFRMQEYHFVLHFLTVHHTCVP